MLFISLHLPSLSRYRLKFSADKVDTMIVQAICKYMAESDLFSSVFSQLLLLILSVKDELELQRVDDWESKVEKDKPRLMLILHTNFFIVRAITARRFVYLSVLVFTCLF